MKGTRNKTREVRVTLHGVAFVQT